MALAIFEGGSSAAFLDITTESLYFLVLKMH